VNADGSSVELYNIATDPGETTNRAATEPPVAKRLTDAVLAWRKSLP
jgi:hypothetical protein